jgi:hypothetical protein
VDAELTIDNAQALRWKEGDAGGENYLEIQAPATVTTTQTCTLEDDANFIPDSCVGDGTDGVGTDTLDDLSDDLPTALSNVTTITNTQFCVGNAGGGFDCTTAGTLADDDVTDDAITALSDVAAKTGTGTTVVFSAAPALTGDATGATASVDDNDTSLATTAYVQAETVAAGDVTGTIGGGLTIGAGVVEETMMSTEDFGDFSCAGGADDCLLDAGVVDATASAASLITREICVYIEDPVTDEQLETVWRAPTAVTATEINGEATGGTSVGFDFNLDDGTPTGLNGGDVSCTTSGTTDSILGGSDVNFAAGDRLDVDIGTVTGAVDAVSLCLEYTID